MPISSDIILSQPFLPVQMYKIFFGAGQGYTVVPYNTARNVELSVSLLQHE